MINGLMVFSLLVLSNVMLTNGFGALALQRNKNNLWFVLLNSVTVMVVMLSCCSLYGVIYMFLLDPFNVTRLGIIVMVLLSGIANFCVLEIIKLTNKEMYYYYDMTYSFVINLGLTVGMMLCINFNQGFTEMLIESSLVVLGYVIVSLLFGLIYKRLHNQKVSRLLRPVPITISVMAVLSMIIYAISISI